MPVTYVPVAQVTLLADAQSVVFGNITGYTDLRIVAQTRSVTNASAASTAIRFNGDSAGNYSSNWVSYYNSAVYGSSNSNATGIESAVRLNTVGSGEIRWGTAEWELLSYANTSTHKTVLGWSFADQEIIKVSKGVGVWRSTAAITRIEIYGSYLFAAGSTFSVYGILAA